MKHLPWIFLLVALAPVSEPDRYAKEFSELCGVSVASPIFFKEQPEGVLASCTTLPFRQGKWIEVDPKHWKELSDTAKRWLIFHELGHCELGLDHSVSFPPGIMHETLPVGIEDYWSLSMVKDLCPLTFKGR